ncbi:hypothetical protein Cgig2_031120 [Carnegiea gigantea]|uniref:Uncharacterized protein n=1 Tax=Carnegiea gigantea TaxID=171969 RepID=A0A9Q1JL90_9CARY|nr:hypothetical protein Cgig2_031120 [Carnegiea gigantea]
MMSSSLPCTLPVCFQGLLDLTCFRMCSGVRWGCSARKPHLLSLSPIHSVSSILSLKPFNASPRRSQVPSSSGRGDVHASPFCSYGLATESLPPTNSENGDNTNLNQDTTPSATAKSTYPHSMGRGGSDHPCNPIEKGQPSYAKAMKFGMGCTAHPSNLCPEERIGPPLPPSIPLPANMRGSLVISLKGKSMKVPLIYEGLYEICALCGSKFHQIEVCPDLPLQSKVEIVVEKFGGASGLSSIKPAQGRNLEDPVNEDPLNAMEEDLLEEANNDIYGDSQENYVDEEDMDDSFLNLDPIQDLEMSTESAKRRGWKREMKASQGLLTS